jgi:hypothetical protein
LTTGLSSSNIKIFIIFSGSQNCKRKADTFEGHGAMDGILKSIRPFAKKKFIFFLESTIKNKLKSKISEF